MKHNVFRGVLSLIVLTGFWMASSAGVRVQFKDSDGTPVSEWMRLEFKIVNDQSVSYNLANTTLKYYFSDAARIWSTAIWSFLINSNQANASTITATVDAEPALTNGWVLTLKFSSGTINANSNCWVLVGVHNQVWKVDERDDYSYKTGIVFLNDDHIILTQETPQAALRLWGSRLFKAVENGNAFTVSSNPIISFDDRQHYSSDPAVADINGALVLISSTDLHESGSGGWPMNGIHLYTTYGENTLNTQWWEHGIKSGNVVQPIISLADFSGTEGTTNKCMFAPDLQYVPEWNMIVMYIPFQKADGSWAIGVASTNTSSAGTDNETNYYDQFSVPKGSKWENVIFDNTGTWNHPAQPIDPGIFEKINPDGQPTGQYYMLYVDASRDDGNSAQGNPHGNISMASIHSDNMAVVHSMGKISFAQPYYDYKILTNFMEGPDVTVMHTPSGKAYYYMVFSALDLHWTDHDCGLIGYAMADPSDFVEGNELTCWHFKGWIFQDFETTGNNHADLVEYGDKHYIFYHQGSNTPGDHQREVFCKEFEIADNGEIVGVTHPDENNVGDKNEKWFLDNYGCLDGTTKSIAKGFIDVRDSIKNISNQSSVIAYSSFKNVTGNDLSSFKMVFYITVGSGERVTVNTRTGFESYFSLQPLRHLGTGGSGSNIWGVIINYSGPAIPAGSSFPPKQDGSLWNLSFGIQYNHSHLKVNDPSGPYGRHINSTRTTRIGLFNLLSDPATEQPIWGETPTIDASSASIKYIRNAWKPSSDADWSYLTLATEDPTKEGVGIYNKYLNTSLLEQEWYIEDVPKGTWIGSSPVPDNAVRIYNWKTSTGTKKYMTRSTTTDPADGTNYWILNKTANAGSTDQVWIKEHVAGIPNRYTLKCMNTNLYLTRDTKMIDASSGKSSTYGKTKLNYNTERQNWYIE